MESFIAPSLGKADVMPTTADGCYLYVIQTGHFGPVKIGVSRDPLVRMAELQVGNHSGLRLIFAELIEEGKEDARTLERASHLLLKKHQLMGEWFDFKGPVVDFVKKCVNGVSVYNLVDCF